MGPIETTTFIHGIDSNAFGYDAFMSISLNGCLSNKDNAVPQYVTINIINPKIL